VSVERVAVENEVPRLLEEPIHAVGEIPSDLPHPRFARLIRDSSDVHPSCPNVDDEKDEVPNEPEASQHFDGEEIGASDCSKMRLDESVPTRVTPAFGRWFEAVRKQYVFDSVARDFVAQIVESPAETRVTPGWIFSRHFDDQISDILLRSWPSWATLLGAVVLGCNQIAVPPQQRVRRHDRTKLVKRRPANGFGLFGESATLRIRPPNARLAKLLAQCLILGL